MTTTAAATGSGGTPAAPPTVAAFDLDGTLTRGGSLFPFLVSLRGLLPVLGAVARDLPGLVRAGIAGGSAADRFKEGLFVRLLSGVGEDRCRRAGGHFAEQRLRRRVRPEVAERLEWHRGHGHRVVLVSASPDCYVGPFANHMGAEAALATRLAVSGGLLTGRFAGKNCRGAEKYARLSAWLRAEGLTGNDHSPAIVWAYGNSRGDLLLLEAADHGVDAGRLGRLGRLRRFPRLAEVVAATDA